MRFGCSFAVKSIEMLTPGIWRGYVFVNPELNWTVYLIVDNSGNVSLNFLLENDTVLSAGIASLSVGD